MTVYFYDSYALIEYFKHNSHFDSYFEEHTGLLTSLNLVEVYYSLLNEAGKAKADSMFETLYPLMVEPSKETLKRAMLFRFMHKKKKLSCADCIGYGVAKERNIKFLTGDEQFRNIDNVEFVK